MLNLFRRKTEPINVYCQNCGKDLTNVGGDVSIDVIDGKTKGIIFCHGYTKGSKIRCMERYVLDPYNSIEILFANYMVPTRIQKEIKRGRLNTFGHLEKSVSK